MQVCICFNLILVILQPRLLIFDGGGEMKKASIFILATVILLGGCSAENAHSVGVIGGADGPTAIIVTGNPLLTIGATVFAIAAIITIIVLIIRKRKK